MPTLPTGVVTFLFSDIEASTRILEDHPSVAGRALARHLELVAAEIAAAHGVVFETVGDAVYGAFDRPANALTAAVAIQRATAAEDWGEIGALRVRIAVHAGAVETRGDHYFGPALFECARLETLANGAQTITSAATGALAATGLPDDITLVPLGRHRLKDLATPMDVVQVSAAGLPAHFPPLRSSTEVPNNLPSDTTSFIGRDDDLRKVEALLEQSRLVTLLGPGGTGKTRLAIQAAARQLHRFPDGVWLVELAPVSQPELVVSEIADIWGLRAGEGSRLEDVVTDYLSSRQLLLVVDNCEHVRDATANLLRGVLRRAPDVSLVATSRESLGVPGETEYRVPSLGIPADREQAIGCDAVRLFLDRVYAAQPDFVASDADMDAIVRVCRRLDGMPLGLELAAARLRTLSLVELADRLDTSFRILSGGAKTALPRQRTLQATMDWSYDLLSAAERAVFRRLSAFAGGFDVGAAEAVGSGAPVEAGHVLDHLDSLVDKSLVIATHGNRSRFRLLEPIRKYAEEALVEAGEADGTGLAHARHYAAVAREAEPHIRGRRQLEWGRRLDTDHDNLRAALVTLRESGDRDAALDMAFDLLFYWEHDGWHREGIESTLRALQAGGAADPVSVCKGWFVAAVLALDITDPRSVGYAENGLEVARELGDRGVIGRLTAALGAAIKNTTDRLDGDAFVLQGDALWREHLEPVWWDVPWETSYLALLRGAFYPDGHPDRRREIERAIEGFRAAGDPAMTALALLITNYLTGFVEDDWIFDNLVEAVEIARSNGYRQSLGHGLYFWGAKMRSRGEGESVRAALEEAATILAEIGDAPCSNGAAMQLIGVDALTDRRAEARSRLAGVARNTAALEAAGWAVRAIDFACLLALESGDHEVAARLLGRSEQTPLGASRLKEVPAYRARLEALIGPAELRRLAAEGAAMTDQEALAAVVGWAGEAI
jgi:predicted ATPase/class 3 adenylate cyclase